MNPCKILCLSFLRERLCRIRHLSADAHDQCHVGLRSHHCKSDQKTVRPIFRSTHSVTGIRYHCITLKCNNSRRGKAVMWDVTVRVVFFFFSPLRVLVTSQAYPPESGSTGLTEFRRGPVLALMDCTAEVLGTCCGSGLYYHRQ